MSIAEDSLRFSGLFEAEVLTELMLRFWNHPLAHDSDFRNSLLETAVDVLRAATTGQSFIPGLPPADMNLVAALWFAERNNVEAASAGETTDPVPRREWLTNVRQSLPSCFCDSELLD